MKEFNIVDDGEEIIFKLERLNTLLREVMEEQDKIIKKQEEVIKVYEKERTITSSFDY